MTAAAATREPVRPTHHRIGPPGPGPHPLADGSLPVAASTALLPLIAARPRPAALLGAGPSAVYLALEQGHDGGPAAVAVVSATAVRLPLAAVLAAPLPDLAAEADLRVGGGVIALGPTRLRPVRWTDPRPRLAGAIPEAAAARALRALQAAPELRPAGVRVDEATIAAQGLTGPDPAAAALLLGRGPGLTPSGDDALAGALAALSLTGLLDPGCAGAVLRQAQHATTTLSAALLGCAVRGQVIPQAAALLHALCGRGAPEHALAGLLRVGSTSGAALALGLLAGALVAAGSPSREDHR